ncbi:MAG: hypothetical protein EPO40_03235 [Myxococcaceae bacterium]|nr:MAG: hypothetical protein EPO40_03235 [Myxococcaceae bacterium]
MRAQSETRAYGFAGAAVCLALLGVAGRLWPRRRHVVKRSLVMAPTALGAVGTAFLGNIHHTSMALYPERASSNEAFRNLYAVGTLVLVAVTVVLYRYSRRWFPKPPPELAVAGEGGHIGNNVAPTPAAWTFTAGSWSPGVFDSINTVSLLAGVFLTLGVVKVFVPYLGALLPPSIGMPFGLPTLGVAAFCFVMPAIAWLGAVPAGARVDGLRGTVRVWSWSPLLPGATHPLSSFHGISETVVQIKPRRGRGYTVYQLQLVSQEGIRIVVAATTDSTVHRANVALLHRLTGLPLGSGVIAADPSVAARQVLTTLSEARAITLRTAALLVPAALVTLIQARPGSAPLFEAFEGVSRNRMIWGSLRHLLLALVLIYGIRTVPLAVQALLDAARAPLLAPIGAITPQATRRSDLIAALAVSSLLWCLVAAAPSRIELAWGLQDRGVAWAHHLLPAPSPSPAPPLALPSAPPPALPSAPPPSSARRPEACDVPREKESSADFQRRCAGESARGASAPTPAAANRVVVEGAPPTVSDQITALSGTHGERTWYCYAGRHTFRGLRLRNWNVSITDRCELRCEDCSFELDVRDVQSVVDLSERGRLILIGGRIRSTTSHGLSLHGRASAEVTGTEISGRDYGVWAFERAEVTLDRVTLRAGEAINVSDRVQLSIRDSRVQGEVFREGRARVRDEGGNTGLQLTRR